MLEERSRPVVEALKNHQAVVILGMGGIGKSAVAEWCYMEAKTSSSNLTLNGALVRLDRNVLTAQNLLVTTLSGKREGFEV